MQLLHDVFVLAGGFLQEAAVLLNDCSGEMVIDGLYYHEAKYIQFFYWFRFVLTRLAANRRNISQQ